MSTARLLLVYAGLLVLLAVAIGLAGLGGAQLSRWVLLTAAAQALLVIFGFMHLSRQSALVRLFAFGVGFWLLLLFSLTLADVLSR